MAGPTEKVGSEAQTRARHVAEQTRGQAERIAHEATAAGRDIMDRQRASLASELETIVKALKKASDALHNEHQDAVADYTRRAADSLSRFSRDLRDKDLRTLLDNVSEYARRQPGMFLGGAVAAGFLLSRFLRSGKSRGHVSSPHTDDYPEVTSSYRPTDVDESSLVHSGDTESTRASTSERVS